MMRFIPYDRSQPFLMPPDLRDWVPEHDAVNFIAEACERVAIHHFRVNEQGSGSEQYHPRMMLPLLVYCYSNGIFSSRRIEMATYFDVRVRYLTANQHPDHDTIAKFRRENAAAFKEAFKTVLRLAAELKLLKVGTISIDGTKLNANANIHKSVRYDRALELTKQLDLEIDELMKRADAADANADAQDLPEEIARRKTLRARLDAAQKRLEAEARERAAAEQPEFEKRLKRHEERNGAGRTPAPPSPLPKPADQTNLTDADSRIMRKSKRSEYRQCYNGEAAVDADGTQLILANDVTQSASDANELLPIVDKVTENVGAPTTVLADTGFGNGAAIAELEKRKIEPLVAIGAAQRRPHDFRPEPQRKSQQEPKSPWRKAMQQKFSSEAIKKKYALRKQTVEPVFGIIKQGMGFRQFLLRGIEKVRLEFELVALAYNCRRLHTLALAQSR